MHDLDFIEPVPVITGLGVIQEIGSVGEAYVFLSDLPWRHRNVDYEVALLACRAALRGEIEPETAGAIFRVFARKGGILAPEMGDAIAAQAARSGNTGNVHRQ